jgi:hypothetical protein
MRSTRWPLPTLALLLAASTGCAGVLLVPRLDFTRNPPRSWFVATRAEDGSQVRVGIHTRGSRHPVVEWNEPDGKPRWERSTGAVGSERNEAFHAGAPLADGGVAVACADTHSKLLVVGFLKPGGQPLGAIELTLPHPAAERARLFAAGSGAVVAVPAIVDGRYRLFVAYVTPEAGLVWSVELDRQATAAAGVWDPALGFVFSSPAPYPGTGVVLGQIDPAGRLGWARALPDANTVQLVRTAGGVLVVAPLGDAQDVSPNLGLLALQADGSTRWSLLISRPVASRDDWRAAEKRGESLLLNHPQQLAAARDDGSVALAFNVQTDRKGSQVLVLGDVTAEGRLRSQRAFSLVPGLEWLSVAGPEWRLAGTLKEEPYWCAISEGGAQGCGESLGKQGLRWTSDRFKAPQLALTLSPATEVVAKPIPLE